MTEKSNDVRASESLLRLLTTSPCRTLCLQTAEALQQSSYKSGKTSRRILTISGGWGPGGEERRREEKVEGHVRS